MPGRAALVTGKVGHASRRRAVCVDHPHIEAALGERLDRKPSTVRRPAGILLEVPGHVDLPDAGQHAGRGLDFRERQPIPSALRINRQQHSARVGRPGRAADV